MLILYLAMGTISLAGPVLTQLMMRGLWQAERVQISVDNAAILLGREDRRILNYLKNTNTQIKGLEAIHDVVHLCAKIPSQVQCQTQDEVLESQIDALKEEARGIASLGWKAGAAKARQHVAQVSVFDLQLDRPAEPPLVEKVCPRCRRPVFWEIARSKMDYNVHAKGPLSIPKRVRVRWVGHSLMTGPEWNYQLRRYEE